ncbi:MAG TPA: hypothetical protein VEA41_20725 [Salinarimonas sp.]|nr:hypothetical protein [Salinarimonas sp.]
MNEAIERIRQALAMSDAGYDVGLRIEDVAILLREYDRLSREDAASTREEA